MDATFTSIFIGYKLSYWLIYYCQAKFILIKGGRCICHQIIVEEIEH